MTAVNLKGTFSKNERTENGLERIADQLVDNEWARHTVVGVVELHKVTKTPGEPPVPTVRFLAIEPLEGQAETTAREYLDKARAQRGLSLLADTLFDASPDSRDAFGYDDGDGEATGQMRLTGDGPHQVPPPDGAELLAEHREQVSR